MPYKEADEWCRHHNATLMDLGAGGFTYMLDNGTVWYMPYDEMKRSAGCR